MDILLFNNKITKYNKIKELTLELDKTNKQKKRDQKKAQESDSRSHFRNPMKTLHWKL